MTVCQTTRIRELRFTVPERLAQLTVKFPLRRRPTSCYAATTMMMPPRLLTVLLAFSAVALSVVACSSTAVGSSSTEPVGSTPASFVAEYCGLFAPCCDRAGLLQDAQRCKAGFANVSAAANYDPEKGTACLAELRVAKDFCDYAADSPGAPSCRAVFKQVGIKQLGQTCSNAGDCAPSPEGWVKCVSTFQSSAQTRTCQLQIVGKEGDAPCVATVDENGPTLSSYGTTDSGGPPLTRGFTCNVNDGLRCDDTAKKCVRMSKVGGPCKHLLSDDECPKNAYCSYARDAGAEWDAYECVARSAVGAACDTMGGTAVDPCDKSEFCDPSAQKCVPRAVDGAPCTSHTACSTSLCVNGLCTKVVRLDLRPTCGDKK